MVDILVYEFCLCDSSKVLHKQNLQFHLKMIIQKLKFSIVFIFFFLFILFFSCQWADDILKKRKKIHHFHKRLVWVKNKPKLCDTEYRLKRFTKKKFNQQDFLYLGFSGKSCNIYFEIKSKKINEKRKNLLNQNKLISNNLYILEKIVFVDSKGEIILVDNNYQNKSSELIFQSIGWGYKIQLLGTSDKQKEFLFYLYMKYGINKNPWNMKIQSSNL